MPPPWVAQLAGYTSADALKEPRRPGRAGRDDRFYAAIAADYVQAAEESPRNPVRAVAERHHHSDSYIRDVVHHARKRGLLSAPPGKGRAGGELTPKARALLHD